MQFTVNIMSFGFKYGMPQEANLVFDVRCFLNPFYVDELKNKTGNDKEVQDYVMSARESQEFLDKLSDMMKFLLPIYESGGKSETTICIGCTGGRHRSVTFANKLAEILSDYDVNVLHRDIEKE
jgi:UPF0042 nucleotide-binding protein